MARITVFLADNQYLTREGLSSLISCNKDMLVVGTAEDGKELLEKAPALQPDVLVVDFTGNNLTLENIINAGILMPLTRVLAVTPDQDKTTIVKALEAGIKSYVLKDCSKEEIIDAIYATAKGEKFFCGKVLETIVNETTGAGTKQSSAACQALNISERELEIIRHISEGYSNKEIADKLFLSLHTVNTHRKNIMNKLGVNNTAGIVIFAIKEQIISPNKYLFSNS